MSPHRLCVALLCLLLAHTVLAGAGGEQLKEYKAARKHYATSNYAAAKAMLAPLTKIEGNNHLVPYALFYYALSAYYNGEPALAANTFTTIIEKHPGWEQRDEVWYWLSQLQFEAGDYSAGLDKLTNITDKKLEKSSRQMKVCFLRQLDDTIALQALFRQYPEDRDIAEMLFNKVAQQPSLSRDPGLLNTLARDFNLSWKELDALKGSISFKKDSYNVGIFLPFFVEEVDYEEESSNLFVIELYQGIKVAVTELAEQGIKINLFAYDTKKDPVTTATLLEQDEVKGLDLIIGPLYSATIPLVAEFARLHQINFFNPLSENTEVVGDNPLAFLFKSSLETQARKAAEFTLQNAEEKLSVGILYGTSKADTMQAHTYKQCIEHSTGQEVTLMLPITPEEAQSYLNAPRGADPGIVVDEVAEGADKIPLSLDGLTHIYVASKNEIIIASLLNAVEMLERPLCVIGHEAWLRQNALTFEQLKRLHLYFVAPDYIDYEKAGIYEFRSNFYEHFAQYPTIYACTGYEMMLFLGRMLAQYGVYFQKHWDQRFYQGVIFAGVVYGTNHDNQHVPVVQFQKDRFMICNQEVLSD
jgi:Periplasmic binding protein